MKLKIFVEETFTTTVTREHIEIDTDNYPELNGMTEDEISYYIDNNVVVFDESGNGNLCAHWVLAPASYINILKDHFNIKKSSKYSEREYLTKLLMEF